MPGSINSANQLAYALLESTFGTAVLPTNTSAYKIMEHQVIPDQAEVQRPDKNGSLSQTLGIPDLRTATWRSRMSIAPSGTAGTAPDFGPLLQAAFGKAPTVSAGVSVNYTLDDLNPSLSIYDYWKPTDASQYLAIGAVVSQMTIEATGAFATIEFSGPALWVPDTDSFPDLDATGKGGLASFPPEPAAPVTNGNSVTIRAGTATLDSNIHGEIRNFRCTFNFNRDLPQDTIFSGYYAAGPGADRRDVTFDISLYDNAGSAILSSLKKKGTLKTPMDVVISVGSVAGSRFQMTFNEVVLGTPQNDDSQRRKSINFNGCRAHASSGTAKDEASLLFN